MILLYKIIEIVKILYQKYVLKIIWKNIIKKMNRDKNIIDYKIIYYIFILRRLQPITSIIFHLFSITSIWYDYLLTKDLKRFNKILFNFLYKEMLIYIKANKYKYIMIIILTILTIYKFYWSLFIYILIIITILRKFILYIYFKDNNTVKNMYDKDFNTLEKYIKYHNNIKNLISIFYFKIKEKHKILINVKNNK